jgi:uncharacterized protein YjbJ (UPF0337 family)
MKGKVKEKWGKLTDDELDRIAGKRDQLEGKIQERYGIAKDQVRRTSTTGAGHRTRATYHRHRSSMGRRNRRPLTLRLLDPEVEHSDLRGAIVSVAATRPTCCLCVVKHLARGPFQDKQTLAGGGNAKEQMKCIKG